MTSALWLGVMDGDSFRVATQTFGPAFGVLDFSPGPLDPETGKPYSANDAFNFNRVWSLTRQEVEQLLDFMLDLRGYPAGMYFLRFSTKKGVGLWTLIVR